MTKQLWLGVVVVAGMLGCGGPQREPVSQASLTSGPVYAPDAVELYAARRAAGAECGTRLAPTLQFAPGTDALRPGEVERLAAWAVCLNRPELAHTTVVLLGADEPNGPTGLFGARTKRIRDALVARGVAPERVIVGAPSATREGGKMGPTSSVLLELTSSDTLRALAPVDPPVTGGVGLGLR